VFEIDEKGSRGIRIFLVAACPATRNTNPVSLVAASPATRNTGLQIAKFRKHVNFDEESEL